MTDKMRAGVRAAVDFGGPLAFLATMILTRDPIKATGALVAGSVAALILGFAVEKRLAPMPLVAGLAAAHTTVLRRFDDGKSVGGANRRDRT